MAKQKVTKSKPKVSKPKTDGIKYSLALTINRISYESTGESCLSAIQNLKRPDKITNKGVLLIKRGDASKEMLLQPMQIKRLFYPMAQVFLAKTLELGLK